jgi:hypothetical protein
MGARRDMPTFLALSTFLFIATCEPMDKQDMQGKTNNTNSLIGVLIL